MPDTFSVGEGVTDDRRIEGVEVRSEGTRLITPISSSWICDTNGSAVSGEVLLGLEAANRFALFGRGGG